MVAATRVDGDLVCWVGFSFVIQDLVVQCNAKESVTFMSNSEGTVNIINYVWFRASVNSQFLTE